MDVTRDWAILTKCTRCSEYRTLIAEDEESARSTRAEPPLCDACHGPTVVIAVMEQLAVQYILHWGTDGSELPLDWQP